MPRKQNNDQLFISRLHRYISNPSYSFIEWANDNKSFIIHDEKTFTLQILEKKFNMGRFDSFIRKLNKFGFKRSKVAKSKIRFFHKEFIKESKSFENIKKLTKEEALPRHIKLRMMKQKLCSDSLISQNQVERESEDKGSSEIDCEKQEGDKQIELGVVEKLKKEQKDRSLHEYLKASQKQDIGIYLVKQLSQRIISPFSHSL